MDKNYQDFFFTDILPVYVNNTLVGFNFDESFYISTEHSWAEEKNYLSFVLAYRRKSGSEEIGEPLQLTLLMDLPFSSYCKKDNYITGRSDEILFSVCILCYLKDIPLEKVFSCKYFNFTGVSIAKHAFDIASGWSVSFKNNKRKINNSYNKMQILNGKLWVT